MTTKAAHHSQSFNSGARELLDALYAFEEKEDEKKCPPKQKKQRSPEQKAQTNQALEKAREEGGGFDNMPKKEVQEAGRKGGEAPRKKKPC